MLSAVSMVIFSYKRLLSAVFVHSSPGMLVVSSYKRPLSAVFERCLQYGA